MQYSQVLDLYTQHKELIISALHLAIIIPLIFLAINPEYIPRFIPVNAVVYPVYILLIAGIAFSIYTIIMEVKSKYMMPSVPVEIVEQKPEEPKKV